MELPGPGITWLVVLQTKIVRGKRPQVDDKQRSEASLSGPQRTEQWSLIGPVCLTRRKTLAVRDEIQMGAWKAACMFDDYTTVYHRVWDYGDFTPDRGGHKRTREGVRLNVTCTFCLRCAEIAPSRMHLCAGCALPIFYPNFFPNADEGDFARSYIVPEWVRSMGQFHPKRIASDVVGVIKKNLISFSMGSDLRLTVQSGIRLPRYLGEDKGGVNVAWDEMAKVLFQFSLRVGHVGVGRFRGEVGGEAPHQDQSNR